MAKDTADNTTIDMFDMLYPKQLPGRKPIFGTAMTPAQRARRYRANKQNKSKS